MRQIPAALFSLVSAEHRDLTKRAAPSPEDRAHGTEVDFPSRRAFVPELTDCLDVSTEVFRGNAVRKREGPALEDPSGTCGRSAAR